MTDAAGEEPGDAEGLSNGDGETLADGDGEGLGEGDGLGDDSPTSATKVRSHKFCPQPASAAVTTILLPASPVVSSTTLDGACGVIFPALVVQRVFGVSMIFPLQK